MHTSFLSAVILVIASVWTTKSVSDGLVVRVSGTGTDDKSCRKSNATFPCRSLGFALEALKDSSNRNETMFNFLLDAGNVYSLNESVKINQTSTSVVVYLKSSSNLTGGRSVISCADAKAGIEIGSNTSYTRNINFLDLEFQNCSSRSVAAAVLIWNSRDINFTNCVFRNNTKAGINAFDSSVTIERCHFLNNTSNGYNSGETYIEGVTSAGGGAGFLYQEAWNLSLIVKDSIFEFNSAVTNDTTKFIAPTYHVSQIILGGGGLLVVFRKNAQFCRAWIENTRFAKNSATIGGGLYVEQSDLAMGNHFIMISSNLSGNTAGQAAGGLSLTQWNNASRFTTVFKNCTVSENEAQRGAGMNVFFMNSDATYKASVLRFEAVKFSNNHANASSAIRFTTAQPYGSKVDLLAEFIDCSFTYHNMPNFARTSPFTSQRINLLFKGNNIFQQNSGGGAAAFQDCVIDVDGKLTFANNTGSSGGAVLIMSSQIKLHPYSELTFIGNQAKGVGGAVYVLEYMMDEFTHANNPDCFLAYFNPHLPPSRWKTSVSFIENSSNVKGAAIYISSLQRCVWSETPPHHSPKKALRWDKFLYKNNSLVWNGGTKVLSGDLYDIATDTKEYKTNNKSMKVSPGERVPLSLKAVDELGGDVITSVFAFEIDRLNSAQKLLLDDSLFVIFPNESVPFSFRLTEDVYNKTRTKNRTIMFTDVYSTLNNSLSVELELRDCHPGFIFSDEKKKCVCNTELEGVQRCEDGSKVFLKEGYWGNSTKSGEFVTYFCPFNYCNCSKTSRLPGCLFSAENYGNGQCADNREGWMCGKCKANTSVGLRRTECIECSKSGWVLALVIPIVISFCVVVIWLNPGISSELRGPLFFYQVLPFIFDPIGKNTYIFLAADIFNFGGPLVYFLNTCLVRGINDLYAITFGYAVPFLVFTVFFLAYLFSHRLTFNLRRRSMLRSFWCLLLLVYNYLVETSFRILFCPKVAGKYFFFYDGSIQCFHESHLPIGITAIIVLVVLVIPPPIAVFLLTNGYWRVNPQWVGTLANSLRPKRCWWWSVDLCRRVLLVGIYAFTADWKTKKILMTVACMVILAVHSNCQPYMRPRANYAESVYLLVLSVLAIMQIVDDKKTAFNVCLVLLIVSAVHTLVIFFLKAGRFCRRRFECCTGEERPDDQRHRYEELTNTETEQSRDTEIERRQSILDTIFSKPAWVSNHASGANSSARPEIVDRSDSRSPSLPTGH